MSQVLFVGGGLDSVTGTALSENNGGFHDATYAPSCLLVGPTGFFDAVCLDASLSAVSVTGGQTWYGHLGFNFTNPFTTGDSLVLVKDSAGFPWVAIRSNGGSPTFALYYNSNTGASPTWTQLGSNFSMVQNVGSPYQRLDIVVSIGGTGNHSASVYNKEALVATGTFTQVSFTNIRSMRGLAPTSGSSEFWEILMTEGFSTVGARVGYSVPNAAGTNSGWTGAYTDVGEAVESDATVNATSSVGLKSTYNVTDVTVPTNYAIRAAFQWMRAKTDGSSPANIKGVARLSGTDYVAAANAPGISSTAFGPIAVRYDNDPSGSAWTQTSFNAAEFGYQSAT